MRITINLNILITYFAYITDLNNADMCILEKILSVSNTTTPTPPPPPTTKLSQVLIHLNDQPVGASPETLGTVKAWKRQESATTSTPNVDRCAAENTAPHHAWERRHLLESAMRCPLKQVAYFYPRMRRNHSVPSGIPVSCHKWNPLKTTIPEMNAPLEEGRR